MNAFENSITARQVTGVLATGPTNSIVDVDGIRVGHATEIGNGALTGTTCVLLPAAGAVGGADVRGAAPGTRETDLLDPRNLVERANAIVLTGGSAYGLGTVDGVMLRLEAARRGFPVGDSPAEVVPIVPGAVIFDLARGGDFRRRPTAETGAVAYDAAASRGSDRHVAQGNVGAGTGAVAGGIKGGVGSASVVVPGIGTIGALVVVNAVGSCVDPLTGGLYGAHFGLPGEFDEGVLARPGLDLPKRPAPSLSTTLVVVATDVASSKARCQKMAGIGHDGLARAIRPVHTMFDGDTVFAVSTGTGREPDNLDFHTLLDQAGDCVSRAVAHAMLAAETVSTPGGTFKCYLDLPAT